MKLNNYLFFDGQCEAAFKFYAECLGGEIEMMMKASEMPGPEPVPADMANRIMHARLNVGGQLLMGSDWACGEGVGAFEHPQGFRVSINLDDVAEAERMFAALAVAGNIDMPIEKTFWAERFGMLTDRFGTPWMVNCEAGKSD